MVAGSIAILTEAAHSAIDLVASVIAFFSVRKAEEPADESHPYGHDKVENVAAGIEGMLILVGAGVIIFESLRRLAEGSEVESLGFGIAVIGFSAVANLAVSGYLYRQARITESPALEGDAASAHRRRHFPRRPRGPRAGEGHRGHLDRSGGGPDGGQGDRVRRCASSPNRPGAGGRGPARGGARGGAPGHLGPWSPRARGLSQAACPPCRSRRYIDLHVQFRDGTSLRRAHEVSHELQRAIADRLRGTDVLIHLEPEESAEAAR